MDLTRISIFSLSSMNPTTPFDMSLIAPRIKSPVLMLFSEYSSPFCFAKLKSPSIAESMIQVVLFNQLVWKNGCIFGAMSATDFSTRLNPSSSPLLVANVLNHWSNPLTATRTNLSNRADERRVLIRLSKRLTLALKSFLVNILFTASATMMVTSCFDSTVFNPSSRIVVTSSVVGKFPLKFHSPLSRNRRSPTR